MNFLTNQRTIKHQRDSTYASKAQLVKLPSFVRQQIEISTVHLKSETQSPTFSNYGASAYIL